MRQLRLPIKAEIDGVKRLSAILVSMGMLVACTLAQAQATAAQQHAARGLVVNVDARHRALVVSCDAIPGYMDAMDMAFDVHDATVLAPLKPGMAVKFIIVPQGKLLFAEQIEPGTTANFESEPQEAGTLSTLNAIVDPSADAKEVDLGQLVPDFALTDQVGRTITLSHLRGKVVALTFGYSRCPNPNYCYRLSNNLAQVAARLHDRAGRELVLLTIAIDPEHDQGAALAAYADTWKADPDVWHFLTGPVAQVRQVAAFFGMNFWNSEGVLTHTLHTVIIDREGRLVANISGNQFTPRQLSDVVEAAIKRP
jgi:protein SCO1/2